MCLFVLTVCLVLSTTLQSGHCTDFLTASDSKCCVDTSHQNSLGDDHSEAGHPCCHSPLAITVCVDLVVPVASLSLKDPIDLSFTGGMAREIDLPPQLG